MSLCSVSSPMATMHLKTNYTRNKNTLESIKRFDAISLYVNAVLIGFWVFFKWFVSYLWFIVHSNSRGSRDSEKNESPVHHNSNHDQPPAFVVDNYFGRHSYIKVKVSWVAYQDECAYRRLIECVQKFRRLLFYSAVKFCPLWDENTDPADDISFQSSNPSCCLPWVSRSPYHRHTTIWCSSPMDYIETVGERFLCT